MTAARTRTWTRSLARRRRALYLSSPIGLGHALRDAAIADEGARTPTGRVCTPQDIATVVGFLASEANADVNGEVVSIGGGRTLAR